MMPLMFVIRVVTMLLNETGNDLPGGVNAAIAVESYLT
jgi:hypothetical protein